MKFRFCKLKQVELIFLMIKCTISIYEKFGKLCYDFMCVNDINPQPLFFRILTLVYIVPSPFPFMQCRLQTQIFGSVSQKKGKKKKERYLILDYFLSYFSYIFQNVIMNQSTYFSQIVTMKQYIVIFNLMFYINVNVVFFFLIIK